MKIFVRVQYFRNMMVYLCGQILKLTNMKKRNYEQRRVERYYEFIFMKRNDEGRVMVKGNLMNKRRKFE